MNEYAPMHHRFIVSILIPAIFYLAACEPVEAKVPPSCSSPHIPPFIIKNFDTNLFTVPDDSGKMIQTRNPEETLTFFFGACGFSIYPDPDSDRFIVDQENY